MTPEQVRIECLRLATDALGWLPDPQPETVVSQARVYLDFVLDAKPAKPLAPDGTGLVDKS